jgi:hypothetical protein
MASLQLLCTVGSDCSEPAYRSEIKFCQRGGEAGRAHHCRGIFLYRSYCGGYGWDLVGVGTAGGSSGL